MGLIMENFENELARLIEKYNLHNEYKISSALLSQFMSNSLLNLVMLQKATEDESRDIDDSMDGDHQSALASAGWGTDEDYNPGLTE